MAARRRAGRPAALALALSLAVAVPGARGAAWSAPFEFAAPGTLDVLPSQLAVSSSGAVAAAYTVLDVDHPAGAQAMLALRGADGSLGGPVAVPRAQQVLGVTFSGSSLELLLGAGPTGLPCCSAVETVGLPPAGTFGTPRRMVGGLAGATLGGLTRLGDGRLLAAMATERGVWVNQATRGAHFGRTRSLAARGLRPRSLGTAAVGRFSSAVAWTGARFSDQDATRIYEATGSRRRAPSRGSVALRLPRGHGIDELTLAGGPRLATAAWLESWRDRRGFHSTVRAADLGARPVTRSLSPPGPPASGLVLAGNAAGALAAVWLSCGGNGSCTVLAAARRAGGHFRHAVALGPADATQAPAVAVGPRGEALVAFVRGGRPMAAELPAGARRFGRATRLSGTRFAADVTVAFGPGPGREAFAAWTQGTLHPSVVGARLG